MKTLKCLTLASFMALSVTSTSFASCRSEIYNSDISLGDMATGSAMGGAAAVTLGSLLAIPAFTVGGVISTGAAGVSTTVELATALSDEEEYVYKVLDQADSRDEAPELASFIKLVQKTVKNSDRNAVIPSEEEIIGALILVDSNLEACRTSKDKFYKPLKNDLLKVVIENLK